MKLNRNNANINKILNKKVAVICDTKEKELDFRKWAKQYVDNVWTEISYITKNIALNLEDIGVRFAGINWYIENNYEIYEWEIAEEQKICTIKDVVENKGKIYKSKNLPSNVLFKYEYGKLFLKSTISGWINNWHPLEDILELEFEEYKPELPKTTFEAALKTMETKVCRSMFSNRCITIDGSQFVDVARGEYTKLALTEIKGEWVVIE